MEIDTDLLHLRKWCITASPFNTYHRLLKVNRAKTIVRNNKDIGWFRDSCCLWHPHKAVFLWWRDNPNFFCQIPSRRLYVMHPTPAQSCQMSQTQSLSHHLKMQLSKLSWCGSAASSSQHLLMHPTPTQSCHLSQTQSTSCCLKMWLSWPSQYGPSACLALHLLIHPTPAQTGQ